MNRAKELFRSYKFATFIGLTIAVSILLVSIAMFMYYKTDAYRVAQTLLLAATKLARMRMKKVTNLTRKAR